MKYSLSPAALAQGIAFVGKTGSGKTTSAKGGIEYVLRQDAGARVCILDPTKHDWWGLTSSASGKQPGFPFQILGGPHGHVPLHHTAGKVVGELVGRGELPLSIIDMAHFPMGGLQNFFSDFAEALMRSMRGVLYLVLEEAHEFAPKERSGIGNENMSVYWAKKIATAGRTRGIRLMVVTQRTQKLHNDLLGSCETLVAHRLKAPADQAPVKDWLKDNCDADTFKRVTSTLGKLRTGTAWVCSDEAVATEPTAFPPLTTFDNTKTPDSADSQHHVTMAPVDRQRLAAIMGDALAEAEANDPAKLKKRIRELETEIARKPAPAVDQTSVDAAYRRGEAAGNSSGYVAGYQAGIKAVVAAANALPLPTTPATPPSPAKSQGPRVLPQDAHSSGDSKPRMNGTHAGSNLPPALQRVVNAIGWWRKIGYESVERSRACVVAGYSPKASTFGVYIGQLVERGLVSVSPGKVALTDAGVAVAVVPDAGTREELRAAARDLLKPQEQRIFDVIYDAHPSEIARDAIADAVGLSRTASTVGVYIGAVAAYGIIEKGTPGRVKAADWLFP